MGDLSSEANQSKLQQITLLEKFSASQDKKNYIGEVYRGNEYDVSHRVIHTLLSSLKQLFFFYLA